MLAPLCRLMTGEVCTSAHLLVTIYCVFGGSKEARAGKYCQIKNTSAMRKVP